MCDEYNVLKTEKVVLADLISKELVLLNFFKEINWMPKKVIFIDDQISNIRSVVESLEGHTETFGIHYTGANLIPCQFDNEAAKYQVDHFLKTGNWISQAEAIVENEAKPNSFK